MKSLKSKGRELILAFILNILAIAIFSAASTVPLTFFGPTNLVIAEVVPLVICGIVLYFLLRRDKLPFIGKIVGASFVYFVCFSDMITLFFSNGLIEASSTLSNIVFVILHVVIIALLSFKLFKRFVPFLFWILIVFFAINVFNGLCSWYSPNTILTEIFLKLFKAA